MYIKETLKSIYKNMYLIKSLSLKDLKSRYSGSIMGFLWTIIQPLVTLTVYSVVFSWMLNMKVGLETGTDNFSVWLFTGLLAWIFFSETLSRCTSIIIENSNLIKKTLFPSEILHISILLSNGVNFLIGLAILAVAIIITGAKVSLSGIFILMIYIIPLTLITLGLSWIASCLNVFFRDFGQLVTVILNVWFYANAIIFPISVVPDEFKPLFYYNPLFQIVDGFRLGLFKGQFLDIGAMMYLYVIAIIVFIIGQYLFQKTKKGFVDVL